MTFYKYFPNKLELAKTVFDQVIEEGLQSFRRILCEKSSVPDKMRKLLQLKFEGSHNISKEFLADFYGNPELDLKPYIEKKTHETWDAMLNDWKIAQQNGVFRKDLNLEFLFFVIQKQADLIHDPYLQSLFPTTEDLIMEFANLSIYGIAPRR